MLPTALLPPLIMAIALLFALTDSVPPIVRLLVLGKKLKAVAEVLTLAVCNEPAAPTNTGYIVAAAVLSVALMAVLGPVGPCGP